MNPILVAGTGSWNNDERVDWYCPNHPFSNFLSKIGYSPLFKNSKPFIWSTDLNGIFSFANRNKFVDWAAGGAALSYYIINEGCIKPAETLVIAHSHGLQVVLFACGDYSLKIDRLISIGSPVRNDLMLVAKRARLNIRRWTHIHSDNSDRFQWLGEIGDGILGIIREHPLADVNDFVKSVGHSELLRDSKDYHYWIDRDWLTASVKPTLELV